jgi:hypothetical protein
MSFHKMSITGAIVCAAWVNGVFQPQVSALE